VGRVIRITWAVEGDPIRRQGRGSKGSKRALPSRSISSMMARIPCGLQDRPLSPILPDEVRAMATLRMRQDVGQTFSFFFTFLFDKH